jgi:hypothetical protein
VLGVEEGMARKIWDVGSLVLLVTAKAVVLMVPWHQVQWLVSAIHQFCPCTAL